MTFRMKKTKVISFDLDGTLTDSVFAESVWLKEIPKAYAKKYHITFQKAQKKIIEYYNQIGNEKLEWYNMAFWIDRFKLDTTPQELLNSNEDKIQLFKDVLYALKNLQNIKKRLIILSNAQREFVDLEITKTGIKDFFEKIFSATSDFKLIKNTPTVYLKVCKKCNISPSEMVHIGDDYTFDFKVPNNVGIKGIFLNRKEKETRRFTIRSLNELVIR
jgi:putative hydrolase of the HAD superfamily